MDIGIDGYEANIGNRVGIGQYAFHLLSTIQHLDQTNSYQIFLPQPPLPDMPPETKTWRYVVGKPGKLWTITRLPKLLQRQNLDLFFSPTHYTPWFSRLPCVLSIMDLSYLHFPQMFRLKDALQLKYMGGYSIKRAKKILTISEFTKQEIIKYYRRSATDVVVTYPGIMLANGSSALPRSFFNLAKKKYSYILFVGTLQPRKNIVRLIEAFEKLADENLYLVIAGKRGWLYSPILSRIENSPKKDLIVVLDYLKKGELIALYKKATCFTLPSLYEGFGLPVVEALNFGCPVVVSKSTSLPEVVGEAGIYIDPENSDDIARGLREAVQLSKPQRLWMARIGREQIKKFTWVKCAIKTIEVLTELGKQL